CQHYYSTPYGF
nr:immunoglobulin light chain junction region [Macaca mulatta]MPN91892.1 immunoglobulin light chain junction region [Macaca mulatta]MPN92257.1 immunoglobulin light chain junction region [Macaca mulatta]MPN93282.1 immunoglobulin light chain junction region [Macaca mulatta]MPN94000.1 immunoglobulin light chain junction region [Macaca mulatta]